jgi:hypothetical protein
VFIGQGWEIHIGSDPLAATLQFYLISPRARDEFGRPALFCQNSAMLISAPRVSLLILAILKLPLLAGCDTQMASSATIRISGSIANPDLDEASGMAPSHYHEGLYFLHNDDGEPRLYATNRTGADLGTFTIEGAHNRDWEDLTAVPSDAGPLLVVADTGDNFAQHEQVWLYFAVEPQLPAGERYAGSVALHHAIELTYPDGPRDCESVAWDPSSDRIYFLSKRDNPSRIYSISRAQALAEGGAVLRFDGTVHLFRAPTARDIRNFGRRDGPWVSQPTGLDFDRGGRLAAVISYRSLYLFERGADETWPQAFQRKPLEFEGPPSKKEEAVAFDVDGVQIAITTEGTPAPLYHFRMNETEPGD